MQAVRVIPYLRVDGALAVRVAKVLVGPLLLLLLLDQGLKIAKPGSAKALEVPASRRFCRSYGLSIAKIGLSCIDFELVEHVHKFFALLLHTIVIATD